jgi:AbrB family looped-hinge helix DNA binding protein
MMLQYINCAHNTEDCSMETITVKVSSRGYIVLPAPLRKALEIKPGARMLLSREKDRLVLTPVPSFTEKLAGLINPATGRTPQDVDAFIDAQRKDRQR